MGEHEIGLFLFDIRDSARACAGLIRLSFADPKQAQLIRVMILPVEHETSGANGQDGGRGSRASRAGAKVPDTQRAPFKVPFNQTRPSSPEPRPQFGEAPIDLNENNSAALVCTVKIWRGRRRGKDSFSGR